MASVLEVSSLFQQAYDIFTAGKVRLKRDARNPGLAGELDSLLNRLLDQAAQLAAKFENNALNIPDAHLKFFNVRIEQLHQLLKHTCEDLANKIKRLENPTYRLARAVTTRDYLSELETSARRADDLLREITTISTLISQHTGEEVAAAIAAAVAAGSESRNEPDPFRPASDVPDNPPHVVLNFESASASQPGPARPITSEGRLKSVVLRSLGSQSIGAVGSGVLAVAVVGGVGIGKSCALRGLVKDPEVRERFRDGIYYICLGQNATEVNVVQEIAKIIRSSGSIRLAREVLEEERVDIAISRAKQWFADKCVLLLIDDVREENSCGSDVLPRLSGIVDGEQGSRVVFTTRDVRVGPRFRNELVHFSAKDADVARQMLLSSAGLREEDVETVKGSVQAVLDSCCGLPMALAIAGSAIRFGLALQTRRSGSMSAEVRGEYLKEVWDGYSSELQTHPKDLLRKTVNDDAYENLSSAFLASLSMLDKNVAKILPFEPLMSFSEMYRGLMVLQRQGWMPVSALELLWDTEDRTMHVLQELVNANLAQLEYRMVKGTETAGISLHDLHLSFAEKQCDDRGESEKWHRKLLSKYQPEEESSGDQTSVASQKKWYRKLLCGCLPCLSRDGASDLSINHAVGIMTSFLSFDWLKGETFTDEYFRMNIFRHMLGAGLGSELHVLLRNPIWIAKRLRFHEILPLEQDCDIAIEFLKREGGADVQAGNGEWCLNMIAGAARLSSPYVSRNSAEVWFQLYARVLPLLEQSDVIRKYAADIERYAEKPWVKALGACLPGPGGGLQSTVLCEGRVKWISLMDDGGELIACGTKGAYKVFVSTIIGGQLEKPVWLSVRDDYSSVASDARPSTRSVSLGAVSAVCCMKDGSRTVTVHDDGAVQVWNAKTGEPVGNALRGHSSRVWVQCVAFSADGKRVASGSYDKTVCVWDAETGEQVGVALRGHTAWVTCVAFSVDGKRVASGSDDKTVRVWNAETGEPVGDVLSGHSSWVSCIAFSADGKLVASGSLDKTVRVWNAETFKPVGNALRRHSDWVTCVAISADGKRVASGSADETVRMWNAETGEPVGDALRGHNREVRCVAFSVDGKRVASGSWDETVRVWNAETGEPVTEALSRSHSDSVLCVAFSADGKRVASGSRDTTVRLWHAETGEVMGDALRGHSDWVGCVAFSADGERVATGSWDETVRVWETETGESVGNPLGGHRKGVRCVTFSADGKSVASGSWDKTAHVWNVNTGECLRTDDNWTRDLRGLRVLLCEEDAAAAENNEECRVRFRENRVEYGSADDSSILATLEGYAVWDYSEVSRKIVAGLENGRVDFFELVV